MEISQLKFYSYGVVTKEKPPTTHEIMVVPIEMKFMTGTKVEHQETEDAVTHFIARGEDSLSLKMSNSIPARWLKFNSNRITSPDVQPDEQVLIYRLGDTDIYYWQDMNISNVKRLEEVTWAFSADPNEKVKDDLSNAYYMTLSTREKHLTLQTSKSNGEPFSYTLQFNTGEGNVTLTDDVGNAIYMDSTNTVIGMENVSGSYFKLDKKVMYGYTPDLINFESINKISFKTKEFVINCETYTCNATSSYTVTTQKYKIDTNTYECSAGSSYKIDTGKYEVTCQDALVDASKVTFNSPKTVATGLFVCGGLSVGGVGSEKAQGIVRGDFIIEGDFDVRGSTTLNTLQASQGTVSTLSASNFSHGGPACC